ncbi:MAG: TonB family protein [Proteobacteria bacterium]|nr:TonB family protein [Pseudomonadota bacterium]
MIPLALRPCETAPLGCAARRRSSSRWLVLGFAASLVIHGAALAGFMVFGPENEPPPAAVVVASLFVGEVKRDFTEESAPAHASAHASAARERAARAMRPPIVTAAPEAFEDAPWALDPERLPVEAAPAAVELAALARPSVSPEFPKPTLKPEEPPVESALERPTPPDISPQPRSRSRRARPAVDPGEGWERAMALLADAVLPAAGSSGGAAGRASAPRYGLAGLYNPPPDYPLVARRRGMEGRTVLRVEVLPDGKAGRVSLRRSSGHALLDDAALGAVSKWTFRPAQAGGVPVAGVVEVPIVFRLE